MIVMFIVFGCFIFFWYFIDSFFLDMCYYVQFQEFFGFKCYCSICYNFKLEDYEFDEFEFEF